MRPSNVIHLQQRPSKAASTFPPLVGQDEIDHREAAQQRCNLAAKLRAHSLVLSLIFSLFGQAWIGLAFLTLAAIAWIVVIRSRR